MIQFRLYSELIDTSVSTGVEGTYLYRCLHIFVVIMDIEYVDIVTGEFLSSILVANVVLRYWSQGLGGEHRHISQIGKTFYQGMRESLTISMCCIFVALIHLFYIDDNVWWWGQHPKSRISEEHIKSNSRRIERKSLD